MITSALEFWRLALRHKLYTALNVIGLSLGIATFLTLALAARYELGWDGFYRQSASLYELQADFVIGGSTFHTNNMYAPVLPGIQSRLPALRTTRLEHEFEDVVVSSDPNRTVQYDQSVSFVDPNFFDLFDLKFSSGSPAILSSPNAVILSASMARRLFGAKSALGQTLEFKRHDKTLVYRVAGVLRDHPANTTIDTDIIAAIPQNIANRPCEGWSASCAGTYAVLPTTALRQSFLQSARAVLLNSPLSHLIQQKTPDGTKMTLHLVPLTHTHFGNEGVADDGASRNVLFALTAIGTLSLIAGALNYINLATAQSLGRAREVAIRKVLGASRARLMMRFLGEALVLTTLSALLGLTLTEFAIPIVASLLGWGVTLDYGWTLPLLLCVVIALTLGAGFYPAFMLSSFSPAPVLASACLPAQGRLGARLRLFLVGVQFTFAMTLGICTLVVNAQALHLRHLERGMVLSGLVVIAPPRLNALDTHQAAIIDALRAMPEIHDISASAGGALGRFSVGSVQRDPQHKAIMAQTVAHDPAFFRTFGLRLLAGRLTDPNHATDITKTTPGADDVLARNFVISRDMARQFGFSTPQDAIGKTFLFGDDGKGDERTIIGVVENVILNSGQDTPPPTIYELQTATITQGIIAFRTAPDVIPHVLGALRKAWPSLAPGVPFEPQSMREIIAESTRGDIARGRLFSLGAAVAIGIACLGLYGLAAFNAERRMHEVGIRKTLGATTAQIMRLLLMQFLRPIAYASLIAWPLAWALMRNWLSGFDNRITLTPTYFLMMTLIAAILCTFTVFSRTFVLASAEPARAIRAE